MARTRELKANARGTDTLATSVAATAPTGTIAELTRRRAYEIYEERIAQALAGDAEGDWLKAEAELGNTLPRS